jgi:hypothetical protein
LTTPITAEDSVEKLLFGLLEVVYARQKDGFITQPNLSCEISARQSAQSVWEEVDGVWMLMCACKAVDYVWLQRPHSEEGNAGITEARRGVA